MNPLRRLSGGSNTSLVPQARLAGPVPWVIAIMVALMVIALAAGLALRNAAETTRSELRGGITVQIVEAAPQARARQAGLVLAQLRRTPRVQAVRLVPEDEVTALIEPWLGRDAAQEDAIPVPALIDARLEGPVTANRVAALQRSLRQVAPAARVDAQAGWLKPVFAAIRSLQLLVLMLVALLALALSAAVLLAARSALGANRDTIEIVHLLGGTDAQIAKVFQSSIGVGATGGGLVGLGLGLAVVLLLGQSFAGLQAGMVNGGALEQRDWLLLGLVPFASALLAMLTARLTVMRALREML